MPLLWEQLSCSPGLLSPHTGAPTPWRASLLALGCEAAPKPVTEVFLTDHHRLPGAAAQPSGSKLPRHDDSVQSRKWRRTQAPWRAALLARGCEAAQKPLTEVFLTNHHRLLRAAAQPQDSHQGLADRPPSPCQGVLRTPARASSLATGTAFTLYRTALLHTRTLSEQRSSPCHSPSPVAAR